MSEEKKQEEMQDEELVTEAEEAGESAKSADPEKDETSGSGEEAKDAGDAKNDGETKESSAEEEALNVKYMRLMADFQNFKRRTEKEKSDIYAFANEKIVSELLNVIDNFERALLHGAAGDSFAEGCLCPPQIRLGAGAPELCGQRGGPGRAPGSRGCGGMRRVLRKRFA